MKCQKGLLLALFLSFFLSTFSDAANKEVLSGTVISVEKADKYTILQIQQGKKKLWVAANSFVTQVGSRIEYIGGVQMKDFHIKALDRTFPEILFLTNIRKELTEEEKAEAAKKTAKLAAATSMPNDDKHKNINAFQAASAPTIGEIIRGEGELSIADLYAKRAVLSGHTVNIRGKVIKVSNNIKGKSWLTLSDGTGVAPDDMLRVVTSGSAAIGQLLSVRGILKTDVNLGSGYHYKLLVDDAELSN